MLKILKTCVLAASIAACGAPALAATNLTGNYLLTLSGHPSGVSGALLCASVVENGSTLNFINGGTVTLYDEAGQSIGGVWFTQKSGATFVFSSGTDFLAFNGVLGAPKITSTTWIQVYNGTPLDGGTFTAQKNACTPPGAS